MVGQVYSGFLALFSQPEQALSALHQLHRCAVDARRFQRSAGAEKGHQGPFVFEGLDIDLGVHGGGNTAVTLVKDYAQHRLADRVIRRCRQRQCGGLLQQLLIFIQRQRDLASGITCPGGVCFGGTSIIDDKKASDDDAQKGREFRRVMV